MIEDRHERARRRLVALDDAVRVLQVVLRGVLVLLDLLRARIGRAFLVVGVLAAVGRVGLLGGLRLLAERVDGGDFGRLLRRAGGRRLAAFQHRQRLAQLVLRHGLRFARARVGQPREIAMAAQFEAASVLGDAGDAFAVDQRHVDDVLGDDPEQRDAAAHAHGGDRRVDLDRALLRQAPADKAHQTARQAERHLAGAPVGVVDEFVDDEFRIRGDGHRALVQHQQLSLALLAGLDAFVEDDVVADDQRDLLLGGRPGRGIHVHGGRHAGFLGAGGAGKHRACQQECQR